MEGFDCSGLVIEILKSVGMAPPYDTTAQGLYEYFKGNSDDINRGLGSLVFFGRSEREISHVGFLLDSYRMLEAGGGNSKTVTKSVASKQNAFIRIRPVSNRKDLVGYLFPPYDNKKLIPL